MKKKDIVEWIDQIEDRLGSLEQQSAFNNYSMRFGPSSVVVDLNEKEKVEDIFGKHEKRILEILSRYHKRIAEIAERSLMGAVDANNKSQVDSLAKACDEFSRTAADSLGSLGGIK